MIAALEIIDCGDLMAQPVIPMTWAVDGLLPMGVVADIYGPPGAGKSTLTMDLALAISGETGDWHGLPCIGGPVVVLGGERTDRGALSRDLRRAGRAAPAPRSLLVPHIGGDSPPIWAWNPRADDGAGAWALTAWGRQITDWLCGAKPALVIVDTILSAAAGCNLLDQPQQYALGQTIRAWARQTSAKMTLTISHTNQASSLQFDLKERLDYTSRAGGNGLPGALRHLCGLTRLRASDLLDLPRQGGDSTLFAFGVSKNNESPSAVWTHHAPAIFSQRSGRVELVLSGSETAALIEAEKRTEAPERAAKRPSREPTLGRENAYQRAKNGESGNARAF